MAECKFEVNNFIDLKGYSLSKDEVNLIYIPVGKLPKIKAEEYIKDLLQRFKKNEKMKCYNFLLIPVQI